MTQEQKRVLIAQHAGWGDNLEWIQKCIDDHKVECERAYYQDRPQPKGGVPNYFSDLNAINDVCLKMPDQPAIRMRCMITDWGLNGHPETFDPFLASAAIRAEAFGIVMGLWKEGD